MPEYYKIGHLKKGIGAKSLSLTILLVFILLLSKIAVPAIVEQPSNNIVAISSGLTHNLLLTSEGDVWAWGSNSYGECGTNSSDEPVYVLKPVKVSISNIKAIATGNKFSVVLKDDGTVWTWGDNNNGELGIGITDNDSHSIPTQVEGLPKIKSISANRGLIMALAEDGTVFTWGRNEWGQLGDGKLLPHPDSNNNIEWGMWQSQNRSYPDRVVNLSGVVIISSGGTSALALKDDGTIWVWGQNSAIMGLSADIATGNEIGTSIPVLAQKIDNIKSIIDMGSNVLVLKRDGTVLGWGLDINGILGQSEGGVQSGYQFIYTPTQIQGLSNVISITGGFTHAAALRNDGAVWTWGGDYSGQLGDNSAASTTGSKIPYEVPIQNITLLSAGSLYTIALSSDGNLWAWGADDYGQLGDKSTGNEFYITVPTKVVLSLNSSNNPSPLPTLASLPTSIFTTKPSSSSNNVMSLDIVAGLIIMVLIIFGVSYYLKTKKR